MSDHPSYMGDPVDWRLIPEHMIGGMRRWIEDGIVPGEFLCAVLCNDLRQAVERADEVNIHRLPDYVRFLYMYAPMGSWGSPQDFRAWAKHKGLRSMGWTADICRD